MSFVACGVWRGLGESSCKFAVPAVSISSVGLVSAGVGNCQLCPLDGGSGLSLCSHPGSQR